jgi:DNA-directed RNA polymerase subunit RPC12/RpoP
MAKNIKAIKCPHCGSIKITTLRPDYYKCDSCGTEFFLDNDDININHNYNYPRNNQDQYKAIRIVLFAVVGFIALMFVIGGLSALFSKKPEPNYSTYSSSKTTDKEEEAEPLEWNYASNLLFLDKDNTPHVVVVGNVGTFRKRMDENKDNKVYIGLFDPKTGKKEWVKALMETPVELSSSDVKLQVFEDQNLYIIVKSKYIYQLDKNTLTYKSVLENYVKDAPSLSTGIAKVEFKYEDYGSAYQIINNEGQNLAYYPLINKSIPDKQLYDERRKKLPNPTTKTEFTFSSKSSYYPEEKIQLIQYSYQYQYGFPKDSPRFSWDKDYGGSGIFTDRDPYKKVLINPWQFKGARLINFKDFTPGRLYFQPVVVAQNDKTLLIAYKPTPAEDDPLQIQLLDITTGAIQKTITTDLKSIYGNGCMLKDGFIVKGASDYYYFDNSGKQINKFEGYNPKFDTLN